MLTANELKWYSKEEDVKTDSFRAMIKLRFIHEIVKLSVQDSTPSFRIGVSMYYDADHKEQSKRDVTLSCYSCQDRDRWVAAIEYLKTRIIYDEYTKKNTLVNFLG